MTSCEPHLSRIVTETPTMVSMRETDASFSIHVSTARTRTRGYWSGIIKGSLCSIVSNDDVSRMKQAKRAQVAVSFLYRVNSCTRPFHSNVFLNWYCFRFTIQIILFAAALWCCMHSDTFILIDISGMTNARLIYSIFISTSKS